MFGLDFAYRRKRWLVPQPTRPVLVVVPLQTLVPVESEGLVRRAEVDEVSAVDECPFVPRFDVAVVVGGHGSTDVDLAVGRRIELEGFFENLETVLDEPALR